MQPRDFKTRVGALLLLVVFVSACEPVSEGQLGEFDADSLDEVMLNFASSNESVAYFASALAKAPNDPVAKRNLAGALAKAQRYEESVVYYGQVVEAGATMSVQDRLTYADGLLHTGKWKTAEQQIAKVPEGYRSYEKERIAAVLADIRKDWNAADQHYKSARALTVTPAPILNNWGVSKLSRGSYSEAESKFREAVSFDQNLFAAKNNLVLARGRQGNYSLPVIPMTETERAQLLHDLAVVAIDNGDEEIAEALLEDALASHPQHFEAAASKLAGL